jgi:hypothetical protein
VLRGGMPPLTNFCMRRRFAIAAALGVAAMPANVMAFGHGALLVVGGTAAAGAVAVRAVADGVKASLA